MIEKIWPNWIQDSTTQWAIAIGVTIVLAIIGYWFSRKRSADESTSTELITGGNQSPTIHTKGDVNLHYKGISDNQFKALLESLNQELGGQTNPKLDDSTQNALLKNLLDQVKDQKLTIVDLQTTITQQVQRIVNILKDENISDAVKSLIQTGDLDRAETLVDRHYAEQVTAQEKSLAQILYERGQVKALKLNYRVALESFEKAATLQPTNSLYLNQAGLTAHDLAEYDTAIAYFEQALTSDLKTFGEDHPKVATDRNNLGGPWNDKGEYDKAITYYEQALKVCSNMLGEQHPTTKTVRENLRIARSNRDG